MCEGVSLGQGYTSVRLNVEAARFDGDRLYRTNCSESSHIIFPNHCSYQWSRNETCHLPYLWRIVVRKGVCEGVWEGRMCGRV